MDSEPDPNQSRKADYVVQRTRRRLMATDTKEYHRLLDRNPALGLPGPFTDRDQILHQLRALKEKEHRENTSALFVREYMRFKFSASSNSVEWRLDTNYNDRRYFLDCYNKSVAMYLFYPDANQAYRCNNGVLCDSMLGFTVIASSHFHHRLVQSLSPDAFKNITSQMLQELRTLPVPSPSGQPQEEPFTTLSRSQKVPPPFKCLFIVVHQTQVSRTERFTVEETDNIPVTLVQTWSMEGLKYPISFHSLHRNGGVLSEHNPSDNSVCSVRTNLKSAIRFVLDLEKREEGFWGTKPRPPLADSSVDIEKEARELGWDDATHGKLPLNQPSSTWANRRKYPD
ncbi:hypothetical protein FCIRC_8464 [Fusarium circinatum]|uniref:Uncharacterized protein n=1 Tax=Fusarium circinatum TaxID=48490 RepID=A0A8H5TMQ9_FUSCI|nr:hypothetical protein FCIRC_8464 [Fusarium circinatum]